MAWTFWGGGNKTSQPSNLARLPSPGGHAASLDEPRGLPQSQSEGMNRNYLHGQGRSRSVRSSTRPSLDARQIGSHMDDSSDESQAEEVAVMLDDAAHSGSVPTKNHRGRGRIANHSEGTKRKLETTVECESSARTRTRTAKKRKADFEAPRSKKSGAREQVESEYDASSQSEEDESSSAISNDRDQSSEVGDAYSDEEDESEEEDDEGEEDYEDEEEDEDDSSEGDEYEHRENDEDEIIQAAGVQSGQRKKLRAHDRALAEASAEAQWNSTQQDQQLTRTPAHPKAGRTAQALETRLKQRHDWIMTHIGRHDEKSIALQDILIVYKDQCAADSAITLSRIRVATKSVFPELNTAESQGLSQSFSGYHWQTSVLSEVARSMMRSWIRTNIIFDPQLSEPFQNSVPWAACKENLNDLADLVSFSMFWDVLQKLFPDTDGMGCGLRMEPPSTERLVAITDGSLHTTAVPGHPINSVIGDIEMPRTRFRDALQTWFRTHYVRLDYYTLILNRHSVSEVAKKHFGRTISKSALNEAINQVFPEPQGGLKRSRYAGIVSRDEFDRAQGSLETSDVGKWLRSDVRYRHESEVPYTKLRTAYYKFSRGCVVFSKLVLAVALKHSFPNLETTSPQKGIITGIELIGEPVKISRSAVLTRIRSWVRANLLPTPGSSVNLREMIAVYEIAYPNDGISIAMLRSALQSEFSGLPAIHDGRAQGLKPYESVASQWSSQLLQLGHLQQQRRDWLLAHGQHNKKSKRRTKIATFLRLYTASHPEDSVALKAFTLEVWTAFPPRGSKHTGLRYVEDSDDMNSMAARWINANVIYDSAYALELVKIYHLYEAATRFRVVSMDAFHSMLKVLFPRIDFADTVHLRGIKYRSSVPCAVNWKLEGNTVLEADAGKTVQPRESGLENDPTMSLETRQDHQTARAPVHVKAESQIRLENANAVCTNLASRTDTDTAAHPAHNITPNIVTQSDRVPVEHTASATSLSQQTRTDRPETVVTTKTPKAIAIPTNESSQNLISRVAQENSTTTHVAAEWFRQCIMYEAGSELDTGKAHSLHSDACIVSGKQPYTRPMFSRALARLFPEVQVVQDASHVRGLKFTAMAQPAPEDSDVVPAPRDGEEDQASSSSEHRPKIIKAEPVDLSEDENARNIPDGAFEDATLPSVSHNTSTPDIPPPRIVPSALATPEAVQVAISHIILDSPDHLLFHHHLSTVIAACPSISSSIHGLDGMIDLVQAKAKEFGVTRDLSRLNRMLRGVWLQRHVSHLAEEVRSSEAFVQVAASILTSGTQHHGPDFVEQVLARVKQVPDKDTTMPS